MKTPIAALATIVLCNCSPNELYVAHDTILGINAKVNQGRQQGQLLIGYDRDFATIIPTKVPVEGNPNETEAMSLVHCSRIKINGIYLDEYSDFTATGDAAGRVAQDPAAVRSATRCTPVSAGEE